MPFLNSVSPKKKKRYRYQPDVGLVKFLSHQYKGLVTKFGYKWGYFELILSQLCIKLTTTLQAYSGLEKLILKVYIIYELN